MSFKLLISALVIFWAVSIFAWSLSLWLDERRENYFGVMTKEEFEDLFFNPICIKNGELKTDRMNNDVISVGKLDASKIKVNCDENKGAI